ncbi:MAG: LysM peptidoglycan-binding domain-containing M23 family metallopeptidase, partial [Acidobacteria bacterium]|nr:LysM peptidoglycan-binding domain-containing M23 family metallopeptidase [Acidobacteriota bacterium]
PLRRGSLILLLAAAGVCALAGSSGLCSESAAARPAGPCPIQPAREDSSAPSGACHLLKPGQTLYALSRAYQVPIEILVEANGIADPSRIQAGRVLFIPGAPRALEIPATFPAQLIWPLSGVITSSFGSERMREHHEGIDIDGVMGQVVRAAAAGRVVWAGSERGYGNLVIIDHGGGLSTLYAHASRLLVGPDETVESGEPVAEVGDTGNARGAHLHFEVHRNGQPVNPLPMLGTGVARASAQP